MRLRRHPSGSSSIHFSSTPTYYWLPVYIPFTLCAEWCGEPEGYLFEFGFHFIASDCVPHRLRYYSKIIARKFCQSTNRTFSYGVNSLATKKPLPLINTEASFMKINLYSLVLATHCMLQSFPVASHAIVTGLAAV